MSPPNDNGVKFSPGTDIRLLHILPHSTVELINKQGHQYVKTLFKEDVDCFIKAPTHENLRSLAAMLLTYQDSFLCGPTRKPE